MKDITAESTDTSEYTVELYNYTRFTYLKWTFKNPPAYIRRHQKYFHIEDVADLKENRELLQKTTKIPFAHTVYLTNLLRMYGEYVPPEDAIWEHRRHHRDLERAVSELTTPMERGHQQLTYSMMDTIMLQKISEIPEHYFNIWNLEITDDKGQTFPGYCIAKNMLDPTTEINGRVLTAIANEDGAHLFQKYDAVFQAYDGSLRPPWYKCKLPRAEARGVQA